MNIPLLQAATIGVSVILTPVWTAAQETRIQVFGNFENEDGEIYAATMAQNPNIPLENEGVYNGEVCWVYNVVSLPENIQRDVYEIIWNDTIQVRGCISPDIPMDELPLNQATQL